MEQPPKRLNTPSEVNKRFKDMDEPGELSFFDDFDSIPKDQLKNRNKDRQATTVASSVDGVKPGSEYEKATQVDTKQSKLQRLLDGAALMAKVCGW